jgi:hypothetical protein
MGGQPLLVEILESYEVHFLAFLRAWLLGVVPSLDLFRRQVRLAPVLHLK